MAGHDKTFESDVVRSGAIRNRLGASIVNLLCV